MRLSAAVVIKTNTSWPQTGVCVCVGPHPLSINDLKDGKIIIPVDHSLRSFKHLAMKSCEKINRKTFIIVDGF